MSQMECCGGTGLHRASCLYYTGRKSTPEPTPERKPEGEDARDFAMMLREIRDAIQDGTSLPVHAPFSLEQAADFLTALQEQTGERVEGELEAMIQEVPGSLHYSHIQNQWSYRPKGWRLGPSSSDLVEAVRTAISAWKDRVEVAHTSPSEEAVDPDTDDIRALDYALDRNMGSGVIPRTRTAGGTEDE